MTAAHVALELSGAVDYLGITWQAGEVMLRAVQFAEDSEGTRYNTLVAIQEMVTNVLRHARGVETGQSIRVEFTVDDDTFTVRLMDKGQPFDPRSFVFQTSDPDRMPTAAGGYGIMIATEVMDILDYEQDGEWNVLTMIKLAKVQDPVARAES